MAKTRMGYLAANSRWEVDAWRLDQLEQDSKDLQRAKDLIKRLRAYNTALKSERTAARNRLVARYDQLTSIPHKYGFTLAVHEMGIPFDTVSKREARAANAGE